MRRPGLQWLATAVFLGCAGCCDPGVHEVTIDLAGKNFGTPGDSVAPTSYAFEGVHFPCGKLIYTSLTEPNLWQYASTDSTIASIDAHGEIRMRRPGYAFVTAQTSGVTSEREYVVVSPRPASLKLTALTSTARVGDTVQFRIEATDSAGAPLSGVYTQVDLLPGRMGQLLPAPSAPEIWAYSTPTTIRVIALQPGSLRMVAFTYARPSVTSNRDSIQVGATGSGAPF